MKHLPPVRRSDFFNDPDAGPLVSLAISWREGMRSAPFARIRYYAHMYMRHAAMRAAAIARANANARAEPS